MCNLFQFRERKAKKDVEESERERKKCQGIYHFNEVIWTLTPSNTETLALNSIFHVGCRFSFYFYIFIHFFFCYNNKKVFCFGNRVNCVQKGKFMSSFAFASIVSHSSFFNFELCNFLITFHCFWQGFFLSHVSCLLSFPQHKNNTQAREKYIKNYIKKTRANNNK